MPDYQKIVSVVSDHYVDVIAWDSRIAADSQRYSGWFLAFTTAGLALIITQSRDFLDESWLGTYYASILVIVSVLFLFVASALGVIHHYVAKEYIANSRRMRTLVLKQKCWLLINSDEMEFSEEIFSQIRAGEFLDEPAKKNWQEFESTDARLTWMLGLALAAQQGCAGIGYIALLISSLDQDIFAAVKVFDVSTLWTNSRTT